MYFPIFLEILLNLSFEDTVTEFIDTDNIKKFLEEVLALMTICLLYASGQAGSNL